MNMRKWVLSMVWTLVFLLMLCVPAGAEEEEIFDSGDFRYRVLEDGTAEITDYDVFATELDVPANLDGKTVTSIGEDAFYDCDSLTSITLPDSVTSIGDSAFDECNNLTLTVGHDSYALQYARKENIPYIYPDSYDWLND